MLSAAELFSVDSDASWPCESFSKSAGGGGKAVIKHNQNQYRKKLKFPKRVFNYFFAEV